MRHNWRIALALLHDLLACAGIWLFAFWLRFNFDVPAQFQSTAFKSVIWVMVVHAPIFIAFKIYHGIWQFSSLPELRRIIVAVMLSSFVVPVVLVILGFSPLPPRAIFIMVPFLLIIAMGGSRFAYRTWRERKINLASHLDQTPVLIAGSEESALNLIKDLVRSSKWRVEGVLVNSRTNYGRELHGVKILGAISEIGVRAQALGVKHVIVAMPEATPRMRREAIEFARSASLQVLTVPSFDDLMSGRVTVSQIRSVELDDLLGRDPVVLDAAGMLSWVSNNVVLVSGAGGSIGSELCRQVARYQPRELILLELNEFALYRIEQEFSEKFPNVKISCAIGDVKNPARVKELLDTHRPSIVFHAAAYKHVPLMETGNVWEAVVNNVLGTYVLAAASIGIGVKKFVLVSTDKAVNPTNVMGASKRLAEMVCLSIQQSAETQFVIVRFGNVLGSAGSVIPKFRTQIANGGPVTVTHPDITRYFMSIPEAVQLVLQAGLMGRGGEIFVLDMGEPVRITDLARDLIRLSGFSENDILIVYTGLRPGEKLYEETLGASEDILPTPHPMLHVAKAQQESAGWLDAVVSWLKSNNNRNDRHVKAELARLVPEYTPQM
jgi:FlaA1/EpsC-like NDP-sugar epimerase